MLIVPDVNMSGIITAILAQMGTAGTGLLHCHLYSNDLTPSKTNVIADFTEVTNVQVPGYAAKSINWFAGTPYREQTGAWVGPNSLADPAFVATGAPPSPQIVYGYFLTDSTDAILLGSGQFTTPFTFFAVGDGFRLSSDPQLIQSDTGTLTLTLADPEPL